MLIDKSVRREILIEKDRAREREGGPYRFIFRRIDRIQIIMSEVHMVSSEWDQLIGPSYELCSMNI